MIKLNNISENLHLMIEIVGEDKFLELCKVYGGNVVYLPAFSKIVKDKRNYDIVRRYNGKNADSLAVEFGLTSNYVKRIINENIKKYKKF
jgi:Mor family transcriptional regulator